MDDLDVVMDGLMDALVWARVEAWVDALYPPGCAFRAMYRAHFERAYERGPYG